MSNMNNDKKTI